MSNTFDKNNIIIFDGICLLCNSVVYFLQKRLRNSEYKFVASQSNEGKGLILKFGLGNLPKETIILIKSDKLFIKSDAILNIIDDMPIQWILFKILNFTPKVIRDWVYDKISENRHLIFRKANDKK